MKKTLKYSFILAASLFAVFAKADLLQINSNNLGNAIDTLTIQDAEKITELEITMDKIGELRIGGCKEKWVEFDSIKDEDLTKAADKLQKLEKLTLIDAKKPYSYYLTFFPQIKQEIVAELPSHPQLTQGYGFRGHYTRPENAGSIWVK